MSLRPLVGSRLCWRFSHNALLLKAVVMRWLLKVIDVCRHAVGEARRASWEARSEAGWHASRCWVAWLEVPMARRAGAAGFVIDHHDRCSTSATPAVRHGERHGRSQPPTVTRVAKSPAVRMIRIPRVEWSPPLNGAPNAPAFIPAATGELP